MKHRSEKTAFLISAAVAGLLSATASATHGAVIAAGGADTTTGPSWRTSSVIKPLDLDGDNVYGSTGYLMFAVNTTTVTGTAISYNNGTDSNLNTLPSYFSVGGGTNPPTNEYDGKGKIDNPAGGATVTSGVAYGPQGVGPFNFLNFTIGSGVPTTGTLQIGILTDNSTGGDVPAALSLTQTSGTGTGSPSYTDTASTTTQHPDWYLFDVTGAQTGDVYTLALTGSAGAKPTIGGVTLDVVPEPSSIALGLLGSTAMLRRRRKLNVA